MGLCPETLWGAKTSVLPEPALPFLPFVTDQHRARGSPQGAGCAAHRSTAPSFSLGREGKALTHTNVLLHQRWAAGECSEESVAEGPGCGP